MSNNDDKKLAILEKIIASNDSIRAVVAKARTRAEKTVKKLKLSDEKISEKIAVRHIIAHYANMCALTGGASGLPALIPVIGHIYSIFGASTADALAALKFEIEMALALSDYMGYDIDDPKERQIAIGLACASLENAAKSKNPLKAKDVVDYALAEYSTRELSKTIIKLISRAIFALTAKRWTRFFPVVGIAIGGAVNKILTMHTGRGCYNAIRRRKYHLSEHYSPFSVKD